ncbi:MAG: phytanoyl-CoA dioxygenase family protein [bacterium]|nr:phytanoyl-CoA dioxygenase family protein [bacterium]
MDAKETYFWDLTGYLVLRNVLTAEEVQAANDGLDYLSEQMQSDRDDPEVNAWREHASPSITDGILVRSRNNYPYLLTLTEPHCEPFRHMIAHPQLVSRLNTMCGKGFRLDHGPQFIGGINGTRGGSLHGAGEPHRPYVAYHHQNGVGHVGGVTVTFQLGESADGDGGFACVPGSHKSKYPMPKGVRSQENEMDVAAEPALGPGDVLFFMDGAQTHGTHPWKADHQRRSILIKYASRTATRSGASKVVANPDTYWDKEIVGGMPPEQRAVMFGPCSSPGSQDVYLDVDDSGTVRMGR